MRTLFPRLYRGFKKIAVTIKNRVDLIEVKILLMGLILAALGGHTSSISCSPIPVFTVHFFQPPLFIPWEAEALGIATCLSADIPLVATIIYNFYLEVVIVLIAPMVSWCSFMRNIIQPKLFRQCRPSGGTYSTERKNPDQKISE